MIRTTFGHLNGSSITYMMLSRYLPGCGLLRCLFTQTKNFLAPPSRFHSSIPRSIHLEHSEKMVRTAESPMDFEWHSRPPMDMTSPFAQLDNKKRELQRPLPSSDHPTDNPSQQARTVRLILQRRSPHLYALQTLNPSSFPNHDPSANHLPPKLSSDNLHS